MVFNTQKSNKVWYIFEPSMNDDDEEVGLFSCNVHLRLMILADATEGPRNIYTKNH